MLWSRRTVHRSCKVNWNEENYNNNNKKSHTKSVRAKYVYTHQTFTHNRLIESRVLFRLNFFGFKWTAKYIVNHAYHSKVTTRWQTYNLTNSWNDITHVQTHYRFFAHSQVIDHTQSLIFVLIAASKSELSVRCFILCHVSAAIHAKRFRTYQFSVCASCVHWQQWSSQTYFIFFLNLFDHKFRLPWIEDGYIRISS